MGGRRLRLPLNTHPCLPPGDSSTKRGGPWPPDLTLPPIMTVRGTKYWLGSFLIPAGGWGETQGQGQCARASSRPVPGHPASAAGLEVGLIAGKSQQTGSEGQQQCSSCSKPLPLTAIAPALPWLCPIPDDPVLTLGSNSWLPTPAAASGSDSCSNSRYGCPCPGH